MLRGSAGNDALYGGNGNDSFNFSRGSNNDVIYDFKGGDKLVISSAIYHTAKEVLAHTSYNGSQAVIDFGHGDSVTLMGVAGHLMASDISIV